MNWRSIQAILGKGVGISENWAQPTFWPFMVNLGALTAPCGLLRWAYTEAQSLVKVNSSVYWT